MTCVRNGDLNGRWIDAADAETVAPEDLHDGPTTHEELWCYDVENMLHNYEMDPVEATKQAQLLAAVDPYERDAFRAWADSGAEITDTEGLPDLEAFRESYQGEWASFREFSDDYINNSGLLDGIGQEITRYFDFDLYASELKHDYTVVWPDTDTAYVFLNI